MPSCPRYKLGELPGRSADLGLESSVQHWLAGGEQLHCASLVLHILIPFFFLPYPIKKSVSQPMNFLIFMVLFPIPLGREEVEWASSCAVLSCWLGLNHDNNQHIIRLQRSKSHNQNFCRYYKIIFTSHVSFIKNIRTKLIPPWWPIVPKAIMYLFIIWEWSNINLLGLGHKSVL